MAPLTQEEKEALLRKTTEGIISGQSAAEQKALKDAEKARMDANRQWHPEGSRPVVTHPKTGVFKPGNWFAKGRADKGAQEESYHSSETEGE